MEAETAVAATRQRWEEAEEANAKAAATREADAPATEQAELTRKAEAAVAKAQAAREQAIETAENAGLEPPDLQPLAADAMPRRGLARKADGIPTKKTQRNFTDSESHLMQSGGSYLQGYYCQAAVDSDQQVIVAVGLSKQADDAPHLLPMVEWIMANTGQLPDKLIADAGYCSTDNIEDCEQRMLVHISPPAVRSTANGHSHRGAAPRDLDARGRMDRKIGSKAAQAIYALRKTIIEPVFGQTKAARGLDRFLLRGMEKVSGQWHLIAITHNILKMFRAELAAA
jgi:hypothetical protein